MRKNRCLKLTALLLAMTMMVALLPTLASATTDSISFKIKVWVGETELDSTQFVSSAKIVDEEDNETVLSEASDPNKIYTLKLEVAEPKYEDTDSENPATTLPEDTEKVKMFYKLPENVKAEKGSNTEVSWTYDADNGEVIFDWENGKKDSFTADITVSPSYGETLGLGGNRYLITIAKNQGVIVPRQKTDTTLFADKGTFKLDENGNFIHAVSDDCLWEFTNVAGNWYTIQNDEKYINIHGSSVTLTDEQQALLVKEKDGAYTIGYDSYVLDAINGNPASGIQGYKGNTAVNLYPESQMSQNGDLGLGGKDFYIGSPNGNELYNNIMLPRANSVNGALLDASYMKEINSDSFNAYGTYEKWHFENAGRNYYYITSGGQYLSLSDGSASLTSTPTKLLVMKNSNGYYSIMDDSHNFGSFLELDCCYDNGNQYVGGAFQGLRLNNQGPRYKLRLYSDANAEWNTDISGYWALVCSQSDVLRAILDVKNSNGDIQTVQYKNGSTANTIVAADGKTDIPYFQFTKTSTPNWYYVTSPDGRYLKVTGDSVSLVSERTPVYVQNMGNNQIRMTDGGTNAVNVNYFNRNNSLISYSDRGSHEKFDLRLVEGKRTPGAAEFEYDLYNIAKIGKDYYRMGKTKIKVYKSIDDYLQGKNDGVDNKLTETEYIADEYNFGDIIRDGVVYEYRPSDYEPDITETINYYKADFMYVTVVKNKIGGMNGNTPRWINNEELYKDDNKTNSFHRNYELTFYKHVGKPEQPLMNMLKIDRGNNYYRLKMGTIYAKDAETAKYSYGAAINASEYVVDPDYDFTNVVINIDGIDYVYSDHVLEGEHGSYFTVKYERVCLQNRVNGDDNWYRNPMGFLDGSQTQYANIENYTVAYHRDYVATLYKGNIHEYGVTISSSLAGKSTVTLGTMITLTGTPIGFENTPYSIRWERVDPATGEIEVIEGENSLTYTFPITEETSKYDYYIVLTPIE